MKGFLLDTNIPSEMTRPVRSRAYPDGSMML
jgi:hypothetical protein